MLAFLFFFAQVRSEIIDEFVDLANEALANSKTKILSSDREDTAFPGFFVFPKVKFQLKYILSSPKTKDIKGYAIDKSNIAIVKRKAFNLPDNFAFVDPSTNKIYQMLNIICSDDSINIYSTRELTIFDLMTNFSFHSKTVKSEPFIVNWDTIKNLPELSDFNGNSRFRYGLGCYGNFSVETTFTYSNYEDFSLKMNFDADLKVGSRFHIASFSISESNYPLFQAGPYDLNKINTDFSFKGLKFSFKSYLNINGSFKDVLFNFGNVIEIQKGYHLIGKKFIEITPHTLVDSVWVLEIYPLQEKDTTYDYYKSDEITTLNISAEINIYVTLEIDFSQNISYIDSGLRIPFEYAFKRNTDKCMFPYLYGSFTSQIQQFYKADPVRISYTFDDTEQFVDIIQTKSQVFNIECIYVSDYCLDGQNYVYELSPKFVESYDSNSLFIQNNNFKLVGGSEEIQISIELSNPQKTETINYYIPFTKFQTNIVLNINDHLITAADFEIPIITWHFDSLQIKGTANVLLPILFPSNFSTFDGSSYTNFFTEDNFQHNIALGRDNLVLTGSAIIHKCVDISVDHFFTHKKNTLITTSLPNRDYPYVLVYMNKNRIPTIDDKAIFYQEKVSNSIDEKQVGVFNVNDEFYEFYYEKLRSPDSYTKYDIFVVLEDVGVNQTLLVINAEIKKKGIFTLEQLNIPKKRVTFYAKSNSIKLTVYETYTNNEGESSTQIRIFSKDALNDGSQTVKQGGGEYVNYVYINKVKEHIAVQTDLDEDYQQLIVCFQESYLGEEDKIHVDFQNEDDKIRMVRLKSTPDYPLKNSYLFLKTKGAKLILSGITRLSNDTFYVYCPDDYIDILVRRDPDYSYSPTSSTVKYGIFIEYIVADLNNENDIYISKQGELVKFTDTKRARAFIVPSRLGQYHLIYHSNTPLIFKSIIIDNYSQVVSVRNPDTRLRSVTFVSSLISIGKSQLTNYIETLPIEKALLRSNSKSFQIYVYISAVNVNGVRCGDKIFISQGSATDPYVAEFSFNSIPKGRIDFYIHCSMGESYCEQEMSSKGDGPYQLMNFKNRAGSNITAPGLNKQIVKSNGKKIHFYTKSSDQAQVEYDFPAVTNVIMKVKDYFPNDISAYGGKPLDSNDIFQFPTPTPRPHNLNSAYRTFCLYEQRSDGSIETDPYGKKKIIPFSMNYYHHNKEAFFRQLGLRSNIDKSKYRFQDTNDECLEVSIFYLNSNDFTQLPAEAVDLEISSKYIPVDSSGIDYYPVSEEHEKMVKKKTKSRLTMYIAIAACTFIAVIAIIIIIGVVLVKKKRSKTRRRRKKKDVSDINKNKANEDDNYYQGLMA